MKSNPCLLGTMIAAVIASTFGCEVTSEKITRWKLSENGAPKIRAAIRDERQTISIRAEAATALGELGLYEPLAEDLRAIAEGDRQKVVEELTKHLIATMQGSNAKATSKVQLQAKDTLFAVRELVPDTLRPQADDTMVRWMLGDWENRTIGENSADKIIKAIGPRVAPHLAERLGEVPSLVVVLATHLRAVGDARSRDLGAERLVALARKQGEEKLLARTFEALGKIGSQRAVAYLDEIAKNTSKQEESARRVLALRALTLFPHPSVIPTAKAIAADTSLKEDDALLRDEAFSLLEKIQTPGSLEALSAFISSSEEKVRYRAMEAMLEGFGATGLTKLLEAFPSGYTFKKEDVKELIEEDILRLGKSALPPLRAALASKNVIVKAISVRILGRLGTKDDLAALEKLAVDGTRLRGWDADDTLGKQAKEAIELLKGRK